MAQPLIPYALSLRLSLRPVPWAATCAIVNGERPRDWAEDFPAAADVAIARILHLAGRPVATADRRWGRHEVRDAWGCVVGGAGFLGPPAGGEVEIAYGVVPSRRGLGYATEVVALLLAMAWDEPSVRTVLARTTAGNVGSRRVLERSGFRETSASTSTGGELGYRRGRRPSGSSSRKGSGTGASATSAPARS